MDATGTTTGMIDTIAALDALIERRIMFTWDDLDTDDQHLAVSVVSWYSARDLAEGDLIDVITSVYVRHAQAFTISLPVQLESAPLDLGELAEQFREVVNEGILARAETLRTRLTA